MYAIRSYYALDGPARPELAAEVDEVLKADLDLSGLFRLLDPAAFLSDARQVGLNSTQVSYNFV